MRTKWVLVVGGGSAGWTAAEYLDAFSIARGVADYVDHVTGVDMNESGNIAYDGAYI